jgi:uncharacterized spore protein YtfJ
METTEQGDAVVLAAIREVVDGAAADRVFGTPITQDGTIVLPVAKVAGGAGGGTGRGPTESGREGSGLGSGVGLAAKPLGVFVIRGGDVSWRPAVDVNRVILGGQLVAVAALLVVGAILRARRGR